MSSDIKTLILDEIQKTAPKIISSLSAGRPPIELAAAGEPLVELHARALRAAKAGNASEVLLCRELARDAEIRAAAVLARISIEKDQERRSDMLFALGTAALRVAIQAVSAA